MPLWSSNTGTWEDGATAPFSHTTTSGSLWEQIYTPTASTTANNYYWLGSNSATTTTGSVWRTVYWEEDVNQAQYVTLSQARVVMTAERRAAAERQAAEAAQRHLEAQRVREIARARSRELLLSHLTKAQRETFEKNQWFTVEGGRSKQLYRIRSTGVSGNIDVLEGKPGKVTHRLCCHLRDMSVPIFDHILAQKIWIEADEEQFLRTANRHAA